MDCSVEELNKCGALVVYGNGSDLGDFKIFAEQVAAELKLKYPGRVLIKRATKRDEFISAIQNAPFNILELHVFTHSIGDSLYLGYKTAETATSRNIVYSAGLSRWQAVSGKVYDASTWKPSDGEVLFDFDEVLNAEFGGLFSYDLTNRYLSVRNLIRAKICNCGSPMPFAKLWGCNAGVENWIYSDSDKTPGIKYWSALNAKGNPKPAIAQALANYLGISTYGAMSGSHIEVNYKGKWISTEYYKKQFGRYPPGTLPHKLTPDLGDYLEFKPTLTGTSP